MKKEVKLKRLKYYLNYDIELYVNASAAYETMEMIEEDLKSNILEGIDELIKRLEYHKRIINEYSNEIEEISAKLEQKMERGMGDPTELLFFWNLDEVIKQDLYYMKLRIKEYSKAIN